MGSASIDRSRTSYWVGARAPDNVPPNQGANQGGKARLCLFEHSGTVRPDRDCEAASQLGRGSGPCSSRRAVDMIERSARERTKTGISAIYLSAEAETRWLLASLGPDIRCVRPL